MTLSFNLLGVHDLYNSWTVMSYIYWCRNGIVSQTDLHYFRWVHVSIVMLYGAVWFM